MSTAIPCAPAERATVRAPAPPRIVELDAIRGIAILLVLVAAAYPAWRSTRVEPVEGLRHE